MTCEYFGKCGSCTLYELDYDEQKKFKIEYMRELFGAFDIKEFEWRSSKKSHYRSRAEFMIYHNDDNISYAMHSLHEKLKLPIKQCPKTDEKIYDLMPKLLACIEKNEILRKNLFSIEFLSSCDEILVSLLYHKKLDTIWENAAKECADILNVKLIGRSRNIKISINGDFVKERLDANGKRYFYNLHEGSFSQPNRGMNEQMIEWILGRILEAKRVDLLELYCGHGNFTIPLAPLFEKVLATEISKTSISAAKQNAALNSTQNIEFARLSAEELTFALKGVREFKRLGGMNLFAYDFTHVLIDPPRAGLDGVSREFVKRFENIIYISCNPQTLERDLKEFVKTHKIAHFALFDQFPYTRHIESGVILHRLPSSK
ncbi:MAG: tRNA (uridine(54)-C5)-methyltransferase TrmA [Campylobacteraceae bacterium]|jgi:tRNA (uracil-5-)-methyltransferase|nr:tRNA (uridine(54)-C5)-methyltransferase TrmA [Campylobacteraceae bacterium]